MVEDLQGHRVELKGLANQAGDVAQQQQLHHSPGVIEIGYRRTSAVPARKRRRFMRVLMV
jgi:hypothetical protein